MGPEPELPETVLNGRICLVAVLVLPLLAIAGLFTDIWQRFPDVVADKPDWHLAFGILAALCVVGAGIGVLAARRIWRRPMVWRAVTFRFAVIECVLTMVAGLAYGMIVIENEFLQAVVAGASMSALPYVPYWISKLAKNSAEKIAVLPADELAGSGLEVLIPPYRMERFDENMGWHERGRYRRQLKLPPLYLGVGLDHLWLETEPTGTINDRAVAQLPMIKVTQVSVRTLTSEQTYTPAGSSDTLTIRPGAAVVIAFGRLGEWLFPCPVGAENVASLVQRRAAAIPKRRRTRPTSRRR
jgi:hypothetical protein